MHFQAGEAVYLADADSLLESLSSLAAHCTNSSYLGPAAGYNEIAISSVSFRLRTNSPSSSRAFPHQDLHCREEAALQVPSQMQDATSQLVPGFFPVVRSPDETQNSMAGW